MLFDLTGGVPVTQRGKTSGEERPGRRFGFIKLDLQRAYGQGAGRDEIAVFCLDKALSLMYI